MAETSIGIEFDGNRVTVVETVGEMAVSIRTITIEDRAEAVELALAGIKVKRNDPPVRVSLGSASMVARKIDVTSAMLDRKVFEDTAYKAMPVDRESTSAAALFFQKEDLRAGIDKLTSGFAAISPISEIRNAYNSMGERKSEVVPLPFVFDGFNGLWLGTRYSASDLTLVVDGHVVAYRQLRAGGLMSVANILGDPAYPNSGVERLEAYINNTSGSDPVVESEVARWVRGVASEVKQTVEFWNRSGEKVPEKIVIVGVGADVKGLNTALEEVGSTPHFPEELSRVLAFLSPADRANAIVPYLSAISATIGSPQSVFIDPERSNKNKNTLLRNKKLVSILSASLVLSMFLGFIAIPTTNAFLAKRKSDREVSKYLTIYKPYKSTYDKINSLSNKKSLGKKALLGEINYGTILRVVNATAPSGYTIVQLSASKNDANEIVSSISSSKSNGNYSDLVNWLEALRARPEVYQAWSSSFTSRDGITSFQISITFKGSELLVKDREIKGALNE